MKCLVLYICPILLITLLSCSNGGKKVIKVSKPLYIDSLFYKNFERNGIPYLVSTKSFAFNDSVSEVLDSMSYEKLRLLNSVERKYDDPLSYTLIGKDTIFIKIVHFVGKDRFPIGSIIVKDDSIFLRTKGYVDRKLPSIPENYVTRHRYFETQFKVKRSDTIKYKIFYRHE